MKQSNDKDAPSILLLDKIFDLIKEHITDQHDTFDFAVQFFANFCVTISKKGREMVVFDEAVRQARIYVEVYQSLGHMADVIKDRVKSSIEKGENAVCQDLN